MLEGQTRREVGRLVALLLLTLVVTSSTANASSLWPTNIILPRDHFRLGFTDAGGTPDMAEHFIHVILPCESAGNQPGGRIDWTPGNKEYRSAAQFHPQSWKRVERETGRRLRFEDPYDVGTAVAVWLRLIGISKIGTSAGWPVCHWRAL